MTRFQHDSRVVFYELTDFKTFSLSEDIYRQYSGTGCTHSEDDFSKVFNTSGSAYCGKTKVFAILSFDGNNGDDDDNKYYKIKSNDKTER